jgi:hypothetical protein
MQPQRQRQGKKTGLVSGNKPEPVLLTASSGPDRRQVQESGPPWITEEGVVLEERRSGQERRSGK